VLVNCDAELVLAEHATGPQVILRSSPRLRPRTVSAMRETASQFI